MRRGFTLHETLDNLNLTHMDGRVCHQLIGRFLSVDAIMQALGFTQNFSSYSYTFNNPLSYCRPQNSIGAFGGAPLNEIRSSLQRNIGA